MVNVKGDILGKGTDPDVGYSLLVVGRWLLVVQFSPYTPEDCGHKPCATSNGLHPEGSDGRLHRGGMI